DRSGSMAFDLSGVSWQYPNGQSWYINYFIPPDAEGSRWAALDSALGLFADVLDQKSKKVPVAVTSYSTNYTTWSEYFGESFSSVEASVENSFTTDYQQLRSSVGAIGNTAIIGGTNISAGMDLAAELLADSPNREYAYQVMIVMTDGQWNAGRHPVLAAQDAANQGIKIFTVAFSDNADVETMQGVADVGGGDLFYAVTQQELEDAFREIAQSLEIVFVE
ncbi:MAG: VWA domain-containing protein, partial [Pirellulaceae bacterium]|nr:VWA domain-containing protein [Pirellulaceae bacterium]